MHLVGKNVHLILFQQNISCYNALELKVAPFESSLQVFTANQILHTFRFLVRNCVGGGGGGGGLGKRIIGFTLDK